MERELLVYGGLVVFGLLVGTRLAHSSDNRSKIYGDSRARFFHYLASSVMASITPFVLLSVVVLHMKLIPAILTAVGFFVVSLALLIPYAIFEKPALEARKKQEDRGWTAEDAKTSGL